MARVSVTRQVVDVLYEDLRSGVHKPGDRLPSEQELAASLGVGRSAVREAIRELLALNVVEIRPGRGTFVLPMRADLLLRPDSFHQALERNVALELLEVRMIVEPAAAALAATRATEADLKRLTRDVERLREALNGQPVIKPPEDLGFHLDLVRAAHNSALHRISSAIIAFYEHDEASPTMRDYNEHRAVLRAIEKRDPRAARRAVEAHLQVEIEARTTAGRRRPRK
ncbi:MAG TPA: GntR family transcriptional regulator [Candidatus Dormibacteraeota bacterium]|nr:GntR family transcriptional regulator [Candidatus Dormibacteraeota bacterium]